MHPNLTFRSTSSSHTIDFAKSQGFGVLTINGDDGPLIAHMPFTISPDGKSVEAHLMRSNPIVRSLTTPQNAVLAISGPHGYISPDWYGVDDQVPTWNYVAVHLRGSLELLPETALAGVLERLSAEFESRLAPKPEWLMDKMPDDVLRKLMRMIVPIMMQITSTDSTWKLAQNKPESARQGAAEGLDSSPIGTGQTTLARMMRDTIG